MSMSRKVCSFCDITDKNQRLRVAGSGYTELQVGVDQYGRLYLVAVGEDESDWYYPNFCPKCGKNLTNQ